MCAFAIALNTSGLGNVAGVGRGGGTVLLNSTAATITAAAITSSGSNGTTGAGGDAGSITLTTQAGQNVTLKGTLTADGGNAAAATGSEEGRVGEEGRSRGSPDHLKK